MSRIRIFVVEGKQYRKLGVPGKKTNVPWRWGWGRGVDERRKSDQTII